jgi:hypothetical protein
MVSAIFAGDKGNNFYLIKSGTCDVWIADASGERRNMRTLQAGAWFGELSLLTGNPRSASIMVRAHSANHHVAPLMYFHQRWSIRAVWAYAVRRAECARVL